MMRIQRSGLVRHIVTKIGIKTNEIMCILVINGNELPKEKQLTELILKEFPTVKSIIKNINKKNTNVIKDDVVFDLYCGIGTISLFMSQYAKKVYGIEIVEEAVKAAKENAKINKVENAEFIAGDVEKVLTELIQTRSIIPDIIMVDPPRKGLDNISIDNILKISPKRVIYISCNPATLMRDLAKLEERYEIVSIKPVDMFPFTSHVECCSVLSLKDSIQ